MLRREWYQLVLKKKSAGPTVGTPPKVSLQLFFMDWDRRVEQRKEVWDARREIELQRKQAAEDAKYKHQPDPGDNCCSDN